jgi:D-galacturonate reductase
MCANPSLSKEPLNVVVIGAGMYVCGSGTEGFGTILPVLVQEQAAGRVGEIHIAGSRPESAVLVNEKLTALNQLMGTDGRVTVYPRGETRDPEAYKLALQSIPRPAAAIVSVPDHLHATITEDVIRSGIHPMVVKPLTPTVAEANKLIALTKEFGVYGAVEFHKRFDEANLLMRQKIRDGRLGDICYAIVEFSQRRVIRDVFQAWVAQTNIFQYLGVHYADMIYFATGALPRRVLATGQAHSTSSDGGPPLYDAIQAMVEWEMPESGKRFVSTILTNWIDADTTSSMSDQKITMVGTNGRYRSDQKNRGVQMVTQDGGLEDINPYFTQLYRDNEASSGIAVHGYGPKSLLCFLKDVKRFIAGTVSIKELNSLRPSFRESLPSTAVVEAVNRSLETGGNWIELKDSLFQRGGKLN